MTNAHGIADKLRQLVTVFWVLAVLATLGTVVTIIGMYSAVGEDQSLPASTFWTALVTLVVCWVGLGWMGLMAKGLAELLAPTREVGP